MKWPLRSLALEIDVQCFLVALPVDACGPFPRPVSVICFGGKWQDHGVSARRSGCQKAREFPLKVTAY